MTTRRAFIGALAGGLLAAPLAGGAQQATRPPAEDQYVEIVPGKTTKQEILAFFGQPDYGTIQGSEGEELIYYVRSVHIAAKRSPGRNPGATGIHRDRARSARHSTDPRSAGPRALGA
jgi:hypothetical protein